MANSAYQSECAERLLYIYRSYEIIINYLNQLDDKTIVNVCLTSTVTRIGDSAFASSSLTAISIST